jgi:hypothetical protein
VKAKFDAMSHKAQMSFDAKQIVPSQIFERWDQASNFYRSHDESPTIAKLVPINNQKSWSELIGKLNQNKSEGVK